MAAEGTVVVPDSPAGSRGTSELDPGHTHVVPGPGISWGDGSPWLSDVAAAIADGGPSLTLVVNGGTVTYDDLARSLERGRPVLVVAGTGRAADSIAVAARGDDPDPGASRAAASPLVRVVAPADGAGMAGAVADVLGGTVPRAPAVVPEGTHVGVTGRAVPPSSRRISRPDRDPRPIRPGRRTPHALDEDVAPSRPSSVTTEETL